MSDFSFPLKYVQANIVAGDMVSEIPNLYNLTDFYRGAALVNILSPNLNTSNVTNMRRMFYGCTNLKSVVLSDTSNVTNMQDMFRNCSSSLYIAPMLDTSNVTNMNSMFYACRQLRSVPLYDTSNVIEWQNMFANCQVLETIPLFDTSNATSLYGVFQNCSKLRTMPPINTSNCTSFSSTFSNCSELVKIPLLDCSKVNTGSGSGNIDLFGSYSMQKLTDLGGFKDLGGFANFRKPSYFLKNCPNLTKESVLNVLNNLYDRAAAGYSVVTLPFNSASLALLSDEEKAIATNKGWTLATS